MKFLDGAKEKMKNLTAGMTEETFDVDNSPAPKKSKKPAQIPGFGKVKMKKDLDQDKPIEMKYQKNDFDNDEGQNYFEQMEEQHQEFLESFDDSHKPEVKNGRIQDILHLLDIPQTFELKDFVLLPDDLYDVEFDIQYPKGYEIGQVDNFIMQVDRTITELVRLLKERNKHISDLATTVDRLQVDANNLKIDAQLANGINIMPTDDSDVLQSENLDLKMYINTIERELELYKQSGAAPNYEMTESEQNQLSNLQDAYSIKEQENNELKDENRSLRAQVANFIEQLDANADNRTNRALYSDYSVDQEHDVNLGNIAEEWDTWEDEDEAPMPEPKLPRRFPHSIEEVTVPFEEDEDDPYNDPSYEAPFGVQNFSGEINQNAFEIDMSEYGSDFSNTSFTDKINKTEENDDEFFMEEQSLEDFMVENQEYYQGDSQGGEIEFLDDDGNFSK